MTDINIISQSTAERKAETKALFEAMKPYLDDGYSFNKAILKGTGRKVTNVRNGWYKDLCEYAKKQGYDYNDYMYKRKV